MSHKDLPEAYLAKPRSMNFRVAVVSEGRWLLACMRQGIMTLDDVQDLCRVSQESRDVLASVTEAFDQEGMRRTFTFREQVEAYIHVQLRSRMVH